MTMRSILALFLGVLPVSPAWAGCPDGSTCVDDKVAKRAARAPELIGAHCSYSTSTVIERVLAKGTAWTWTGALAKQSDSALTVAAPFVADEDARVLANALLDEVAATLDEGAVRTWTGKVLSHDGVRYVVVTQVDTPSS